MKIIERKKKEEDEEVAGHYFLHLLFNSIFAISLSSVQFLAAAVADAAFDSSVLSFPLPKCIDVRRLCAYVNA